MTDLKVKHRTGGEIILKADTIQQFKERLRGTLIDPFDASYNEARKVYNAMHDRRPALIVQAVGVADVIATVKFAREHDSLLAVRGAATAHPVSERATAGWSWT